MAMSHANVIILTASAGFPLYYDIQPPPSLIWCLSAHALHKTVHTLCKSYHVVHCPSAYWRYIRHTCALPWKGRETSALAAVRSTTLRSLPFARYGRRRQFSWRQPGRWQAFKPYVYSYRTQEARFKPDCGTEGRTIGSRMTSTYSFLYYFFILYMYLSIYII